MPEDFSNGQKGICRLPTVSPLMNSTTEAKLPNQTPDKTFGISASAAMPKARRLDPLIPHRPRGAITDSAGINAA